ncbi:hypothetical protein VUR80DRAFT_2115 [Thermomyces stellatus]
MGRLSWLFPGFAEDERLSRQPPPDTRGPRGPKRGTYQCGFWKFFDYLSPKRTRHAVLPLNGVNVPLPPMARGEGLVAPGGKALFVWYQCVDNPVVSLQDHQVD